MSNSVKIFFFFLIIFVFGITAWGEKIPNFFLEENDSEYLNTLFTINLSIMRFKKNGNINDIKPLDAEEIIHSLKNEFENICSVGLSPQDALLKALNTLKKSSTTEAEDLLLKDYIQYQANSFSYRQKLLKTILLKMSKLTGFSEIRAKWFENYDKPVYFLNVSDPIERRISSYQAICASSSPSSDILVTGEIEKVKEGYLVTILFYSSYSDRVFFKTAFICRFESLAEDVSAQIRKNASKIFHVDYGSIQLSTEEEETEIYVNSSYLAKDVLQASYVVPGKYSFQFRSKGSDPYYEVIEISPGEHKTIEVKPVFDKKLQIVYFNIEPAGTKIFINSQYRGTTPFRDILPTGEYFLSTKTNKYYQDYRYSFRIDTIKEEELNISFHLMTKDIANDFKLKKSLYYTAFWNFTFSLATTIPLVVIATDYYNKAGLASQGYLKAHENDNQFVPFIETGYGKNIYYTSESLRYSAIAMAIYTVGSLVWLFYSLFDYIHIMEKKDFIPLISFYSTRNQTKIVLGGEIPLGKKRF